MGSTAISEIALCDCINDWRGEEEERTKKNFLVLVSWWLVAQFRRSRMIEENQVWVENKREEDGERGVRLITCVENSNRALGAELR